LPNVVEEAEKSPAVQLDKQRPFSSERPDIQQRQMPAWGTEDSISMLLSSKLEKPKYEQPLAKSNNDVMR